MNNIESVGASLSKNYKGVVIKTSLIAALAGLLFGLDMAYVNGSLSFITKDFNLTLGQEQSITGVLSVGCAVGAICSGFLSRKFGRKKTLITASAMFTVFTLVGVGAPTFQILLIARFFIGFAVGIASFVAPLYLAEIAPYKMRGGLIAMYQLMITIGIFLMFLSNAALSYTGSWRIMMLVLVVPSALMLIGVCTIPESPRWFVLKGKEEKARDVLSKIRGSKDDVDFEYNEIEMSIQETKGGVLTLLRRSYYWKVLVLGFMLQALQQFTGMNAFMYYSSEIFKSAGFNNGSSVTIIIGLVNVLTTIVSIKLVDRLGRKTLLYIGLVILVISCTVTGYIFHCNEAGAILTSLDKIALVTFCLLFIIGYAVALGPVIWILCSEIQPLKGRDLGITVSTTGNWIMNAIIASYTLTWIKNLGDSGTFWMFGFFCFIGMFLIIFFTPETKNVPLEEIEMNLRNGLKLRDIGRKVINLRTNK